MPVSPPQSHNDNSAVVTPTSMVGDSGPMAYVNGLVEGVDLTVTLALMFL